MSGYEWSNETSVKVAAGLHERRVGDKVFILDSSSTMHALENEVAIAIWKGLAACPEGGVTVASIAQAIVDDFEVSFEEASRDTLDFVRLLHARGVVTAAD